MGYALDAFIALEQPLRNGGGMQWGYRKCHSNEPVTLWMTFNAHPVNIKPHIRIS